MTTPDKKSISPDTAALGIPSRLRTRTGLALTLLGLLVFLVGVRPSIFGLDRSPVVGFVQISVFLVGLAIICVGGYICLVAFWQNGRYWLAAGCHRLCGRRFCRDGGCVWHGHADFSGNTVLRSVAGGGRADWRSGHRGGIPADDPVPQAYPRSRGRLVFYADSKTPQPGRFDSVLCGGHMSAFSKKYGSWALVTGAAMGLGAEFAHQLAARG
jgi:hypothetical protein